MEVKIEMSKMSKICTVFFIIEIHPSLCVNFIDSYVKLTFDVALLTKYATSEIKPYNDL